MHLQPLTWQAAPRAARYSHLQQRGDRAGEEVALHGLAGGAHTGQRELTRGNPRRRVFAPEAGARQGAWRTQASAARATAHAGSALCAAPWLLAELRERRQRHRALAPFPEQREPRSHAGLCEPACSGTGRPAQPTAAAAPAAPQRRAPRAEGVGCAPERGSPAPSRPRDAAALRRPLQTDLQPEEPAARRHEERCRPASERGGTRTQLLHCCAAAPRKAAPRERLTRPSHHGR